MNQLAVQGYFKSLKRQEFKRYFFYSLVICVISFFSILVLFPQSAFADWITSITGRFPKWLCEVANDQYFALWENIKHITDGGLLTANWDSLFGDNDAARQIYKLVTDICNVTVKPIAGSILALVFLLQFIKMAGKADSNGTFPLFKEILVMFLFFFLFEYAVAHAEEICGAIYDLFNGIAKKITGGSVDLQVTHDFITPSAGHDWNDYDHFSAISIGAVVYFIVMFSIGGLVTFFAAICATVMCYARAIQLYAYAAFSPIPLSMLGFEETRSWGVGFFKNFAAVALAGVILLLILFIFPLALAAVLGGQNMTTQIQTDWLIPPVQVLENWWFSPANGFIFRALGLCICFIVALVKSGGWAKDILGS